MLPIFLSHNVYLSQGVPTLSNCCIGGYHSAVNNTARLETYLWASESDVVFFFQAEDGIRDYKVTGVQTCALPICAGPPGQLRREPAEAQSTHHRKLDASFVAPLNGVCVRAGMFHRRVGPATLERKIGRASCRERV